MQVIAGFIDGKYSRNTDKRKTGPKKLHFRAKLEAAALVRETSLEFLHSLS